MFVEVKNIPVIQFFIISKLITQNMKKLSNLHAFKAFKLQKEELSALKGGIMCSAVPGVIQHLRDKGHNEQADRVQEMHDSGNLQCEKDWIA